ncbi:TVP38/TMEM64 family inner membrane protein YdjZ [bacterium HR40]|nr:TVP38/TMEM64 family inner membrane protein YdjZ [bacterium HR40]
MTAVDPSSRTASPDRRKRLLRLSPVALLLAFACIAWASGLGDWLDPARLGPYRKMLLAVVESYPLTAAGCFVLVYAVSVGLSVPGASLLTITAGLLFGPLLGALLAVCGATAGAVVLFLLVRTALLSGLEERGGQRLARLVAGLRNDGFFWLLALRLLPVFPFWLVNLAAALLGMRLWSYTLATALGIVPGALVYASLGHGLEAVFENGLQPRLTALSEPRLWLPLAGLAVLSLLPVLWRRLFDRTETEDR